jgi:predicted nucleotidyltransferase
LLNLSGKIDQDTVDLLALINRITLEMGIEYLVVGATARDLVMHYGYGARIQRATKDLDFAIQIENWDAFAEIKDRLIEQGFKERQLPQRVVSPGGMPVDIVPFGGIADKNLSIWWPPSGEIEMDVTGFNEAHSSAIQVIIQQEPLTKIPVASPQGLALLKLIAWDDRDHDLRAKDAKDLAYLLESYQSVDQVIGRLYEIDGLMEQYDWEVNQGSAHLLGIDAAEIATRKTRFQVIQILKKNLQQESPNLLAEEMCSRLDEEYDNKLRLLSAFSSGFQSQESVGPKRGSG